MVRSFLWITLLGPCSILINEWKMNVYHAFDKLCGNNKNTNALKCGNLKDLFPLCISISTSKYVWKIRIAIEITHRITVIRTSVYFYKRRHNCTGTCNSIFPLYERKCYRKMLSIKLLYTYLNICICLYMNRKFECLQLGTYYLSLRRT